jgi:hypothetical protein
VLGGGLYYQGLQPTGLNDLARIAPRVAAQLWPILFRSFLARNGEMGNKCEASDFFVLF